MSVPGGPDGPLWLNEDGTEASDTEEVIFGPRRVALLSRSHAGKLFAGLIILTLGSLAVGYATTRHHASRPAAARASATPGFSSVSSFVASDTAPVTGTSISPVQTSTYAPGNVPVSAVLVADGASTGGATPDGTVIWAAELHNLSPDSLTLAGAVRVQFPPALPARVAAAEITVEAHDLSVVPPPIRTIKAGQAVSVLVSLHLDCRKMNQWERAQQLAAVTAVVRLVGYAGIGTYSLDRPASGGQSMLQAACATP